MRSLAVPQPCQSLGIAVLSLAAGLCGGLASHAQSLAMPAESLSTESLEAPPIELPGAAWEARLAELEAGLAASQEQIRALETAAPAVPPPAKPKFPNVTLSGVFQVDGATFNQDDASRAAYGVIENGADFRRARLGAKGSVSDAMDYFLQLDFAFFGRPTFTDLWVDFQETSPLGTIRVGQWKQPFSLEAVSSFRYTTFMERSSLFQAFVPFRHIGVGFYDHADDLRSTWALSYLRTGQDQFGGSLSSNRGNGLAGRLTHLLFDEGPDGDAYLHLGAGYFLNAPPRERVRYRTIPELYVGEFVVPPGEPVGTSGQPVPDVADGTPFFVDTGVLRGASLAHAYGTELLWVRGPWSLQSEAMGSWVDTSTVGDGFLYGAYAQLGWFLTGEHRPYDRRAGAIDRVQPFASVGKNNDGIGAWEIAARWSYIDLTDGAIRGGDMQNATFGLNWYVNPYCKCAFNYLHSWATSRPIRNGVIVGEDFIDSETDGFGLRCQIDF